MKARRIFRRGLRLGLLGSLMLAAAAPAANAADSWSVSSFDFGSHSVGSTSPPQTFALAATCDAGTPFCTLPAGGGHDYGAITASGPGFAIVPATDICNARNGFLITPVVGSVDSCTLQVTFKPTSGGAVTGGLNTENGPDVALKGTGISTGNPKTPGATAPGQTAKKKCKKKGKKRSAAAAKKKCKKKRKKTR
jgi:hypothetical protein